MNAEIGVYVRREIDLIDHQRSDRVDAGAAFAGYFIAFGHVDDKDGEVGQLGAEGGGEVVAAAVQIKIISRLGSGRTFLLLLRGSCWHLRDGVCGQPPVSTPIMRFGWEQAVFW